MTATRAFLAKPFLSHLWPSIHHVSLLHPFTSLSPCVSLYGCEWILTHTAIHKCTAPHQSRFHLTHADTQAHTHACCMHGHPIPERLSQIQYTLTFKRTETVRMWEFSLKAKNISMRKNGFQKACLLSQKFSCSQFSSSRHIVRSASFIYISNSQARGQIRLWGARLYLNSIFSFILILHGTRLLRHWFLFLL